jgi:hypothetical protein
MNFEDVSVPDSYTDSQDFRFFLKWFSDSLERVKYDHEHFLDVYDALRCPEQLLWMLSDTVGYKFDDRLPASFCRLVLLYFMSMIRLKGSKDGVTLAAEVNLAQFNLIQYGLENDILYNRLEDTSVPVNSVYVTPYVDKGYFDVVYFSTEKPIDACIEYVRPLGMYMFGHAGVRFDAKAQIAVDARLTNTNELGVSLGPTRVGHYSREDYARMQKMENEPERSVNASHTRRDAWKSNSDAQQANINPGLRAMSSLQLSNNEHMIKSLLKPIFDLGYQPQDDTQESQDKVNASDKFLDNANNPKWYNLRYDRNSDQFITSELQVNDKVKGATTSKPKVNPTMRVLGDAITLVPNHNDKYIRKSSDKDGAKVVKRENLDS